MSEQSFDSLLRTQIETARRGRVLIFLSVPFAGNLEASIRKKGASVFYLPVQEIGKKFTF